MRRVLILAYDGLEIELIRRWRINGLLQVEHGVYRPFDSPRYKKPHTPSMWTSFITGLPVEEHGIDEWWTYGKILDWIRFKPPFCWIKNKRKILWKLGLIPKPRLLDKRDLKVPTMFERVKPSIALFVPGYNEPAHYHLRMAEAMDRGVDEFVRTLWEIHEERKRTLFEHLDREWRLLMCWFELVDVLGHVCVVKQPLQMLRAYRELESLLARVKARVEDGETLVLVVSDHGIEAKPDGTGDHSRRAFWSTNMRLGWAGRIRGVTDFYPLIMEWLGEEPTLPPRPG